MRELLIYSERCFISNQFTEATLHLKNGIIHDIYEGKKSVHGIHFLECTRHIVMPGIIDSHVHINEPGRENWEGFDTATKAAAIGGVTTLIEMPLNASPVTTTKEAFDLKLKAAKGKLHINCGFYGGVIPTNISKIESLIRKGVFGIKGFLTHSGIDEFPEVEKVHLEQIAPILKKYGIPLLLHCELSDKNVPDITNSKSYTQYLDSRPSSWETNAIDLALGIQERFDIRVHIVHLSTAQAIEKIKKRKKITSRLTVETCPHYLYFNAEDIPDEAPIYKCAPPIRGKSNNNKLWDYLFENGFNFLASDHSPAPPERKQLDSGDYFKAWGGISGLQFTLAILVTESKKRGYSLEQLIPLLTKNPACFLGLDNRKGLLKKGYDADIAIWDDRSEYEITRNSIYHRHKPTPYMGKRVFGEVIHTFVNGHHIVKDTKLKTLHKGEILLNSL